MPLERNPWPNSDQASLTAYYGKAGDESQLVSLVVSDLGVRYDGKDVRTIRCHHKVAPSLHRVLEKLSKTPHAWVLKEYAGCYNNRPMRGGSLPSLHARGAAVDLAPSTNGNREAWPTPTEDMPVFGTMAARFNDDGVTALYQAIRPVLHDKGMPLPKSDGLLPIVQ